MIFTMISWLKNISLFALSKSLQVFAPKNGSHILIVSTTGLGDSVWATPAISALKEAFPLSKIYILTTGLGKEILLHNPHIETPIVITAQSKIALWKLLRSLKIATILMFHTSDRYILPLVASIGATKIVGVHGEQKGQENFLTKEIKNSGLHEIDKRMRIIDAIGVKSSPRPLEIIVTKEEEKEGIEFLKKNGWDGKKKLIGFQPGAKDNFKLWPAEYFLQLGSLLKDYAPFFVITGSMNEAALVKGLARNLPESIALFGQVSMRTLLGIIRQLSLFVTNDTGPMHLSFSQNVPTIALFAPTHHTLCGPYKGQNALVIQKNRTCTPCLKKKCNDPFCMRQISPQEVALKAKEILG